MEWRGGLEVAQLQFHLRIQHGLVGLIPIDEHREFANAETPNHFERLGACLQARSAAALDLSSGPVKMLAIGTMGTRGRETDIGECKQDRKSTRLNSSHSQISYAVFCLKKKKKKKQSNTHDK